MKNMHTKSHKFMAYRLDTTGSLERKLLDGKRSFKIIKN